MIESLCYRISSKEGEVTGEKVAEGAELWYLAWGKANRQTKEKKQKLLPLAFVHQGNSFYESFRKMQEKTGTGFKIQVGPALFFLFAGQA